MRKPLGEENSHLPQVNFYSFTGDRRPEPLCKRESESKAADGVILADEGFSILASALRQAQTGLAARAQFAGRTVPARKTQGEDKK